jgi:hypothetical protein
MLGLTAFPKRIELLRNGADFGFEEYRRIGKGEGIEAVGLCIARSIFKRSA